MKPKNEVIYIPLVGEIHRSPNKPNLAQMQEFVLGYIEPVRRIRFEGRAATMIVNEEGRLKRMLDNDRASEIAGQPIVGPAIVFVGYKT